MKFDKICMCCGKKFKKLKYRVLSVSEDDYRDFCRVQCLVKYYVLIDSQENPNPIIKSHEDGVYKGIQKGLDLACKFAKERGFEMEFPKVEKVKREFEGKNNKEEKDEM